MRKQLYCLIFAFSCLMLFTVSASAQRDRASVSAAEVNGTFRMTFGGKYKQFSNEIKILALGGGRVRLAMDLVYPYTMQNGEASVNMGHLDDQAAIARDTAIFESEDLECKIAIKFVKVGIIKVTQDGLVGACGFGHNVVANGTYIKVSGRKPKFDSAR